MLRAKKRKQVIEQILTYVYEREDDSDQLVTFADIHSQLDIGLNDLLMVLRQMNKGREQLVSIVENRHHVRRDDGNHHEISLVDSTVQLAPNGLEEAEKLHKQQLVVTSQDKKELRDRILLLLDSGGHTSVDNCLPEAELKRQLSVNEAVFIDAWNHLKTEGLIENGSGFWGEPTLTYLSSKGEDRVIELAKADKLTESTEEGRANHGNGAFQRLFKIVNQGLFIDEAKKVALYDLIQSEIAYKHGAHKACVVMLGAVLEGLMLGTLARKDVAKKILSDPMKYEPIGVMIESTGYNSPNLLHVIGKNGNFEAFRQTITKLLGDFEESAMLSIQDFRNSIHPYDAIKFPDLFGVYEDDVSNLQINSLIVIAKRLASFMEETHEESKKKDSEWDRITPSEPIENLEVDADIFGRIMDKLIPSEESPSDQGNSETSA